MVLRNKFAKNKLEDELLTKILGSDYFISDKVLRRVRLRSILECVEIVEGV